MKDRPQAKEFAKFLEKRKTEGGGNNHNKRAHREQDEDFSTGDYGEYTFMSCSSGQMSSHDNCLSVFTAALDSGCSSHTIKSSRLPQKTHLDTSKATSI